MTWLGSRLSRGVGRLALCVVAAATAAVLMSPAAVASPESDAGAAIDQTWQAAGGPDSVVGDKDGDVYQVGDGYGQNFVSGKIFFTPATGAHLIYGEILNRYQALGGPADSDLGFPTIDEAAGLVGPDSRVSTFSGSDKPVIFWTPDTGAWVVRGAINAAWDKLGGSAGTLGVPIEDETYNGNVISQKFSGGELSYDSSTKTFSSVPPDLAGNLTGVDVPIDATAAINQAWRAAGGISGPLGARQGAQTTVGDNGAAQGYAGGKIFYSPATGAHAVTGAILSKYESAGGPTGDLGFPNAAEADGGAPNSRVSTFSAPDKPVIFWTPDTGAVVVRGAINAAWDKLGGATGGGRRGCRRRATGACAGRCWPGCAPRAMCSSRSTRPARKRTATRSPACSRPRPASQRQGNTSVSLPAAATAHQCQGSDMCRLKCRTAHLHRCANRSRSGCGSAIDGDLPARPGASAPCVCWQTSLQAPLIAQPREGGLQQPAKSRCRAQRTPVRSGCQHAAAIQADAP